jgi:hypothetical protein
MITSNELDNRFTYHPPVAEEKVASYQSIREAGRNLADLIVNNTPESREQSLAITKLEEVIFWANASIARN